MTAIIAPNFLRKEKSLGEPFLKNNFINKFKKHTIYTLSDNKRLYKFQIE
jgi:hypothetical protein